MRNGWLLNLDWLKASLQRSIFLKVLAVLIESSCTNGLKFTACKHWLEDACCIYRTLCCTSPNQRVNLVDEEDDVAASADLF